MIIECINCKKKFNVDSSLIPDNGRLLQCNGCNHKWFFKRETVNTPLLTTSSGETVNTPLLTTSSGETVNKEVLLNSKNAEEETKFLESEGPETIKLLDVSTNSDFEEKIPKLEDLIITKEEDHQMKNLIDNKKNYNVLSLITVFIISFIALIVIIDTFKSPISNIVPDTEFLLYNLYESVKDIILFIEDLI